MDQDDSRGLLKSILGIFARKQPEASAQPASLGAQARDAWVRADAYLQHETDELGEVDPEQVARTLTAFENLVEYDSDGESDTATEQSLHHHAPYPKLQSVRRAMQRPRQDVRSNSEANIRLSKRRRESDMAIEELSRLDRDVKKRRVLPREEPQGGDNIEEPEADIAIQMRKQLVSLENALRTHWICVCQKCSGLSVRLSLPQRKKGSAIETNFEVFFGVRHLLATTLQEAKITVKDEVHNRLYRSTSEPGPNTMAEFAHICHSITESLDQRNCLHLALEDGLFKRLRPQPKTFGDVEMPRTVSLSALFNRQQRLRGSQSVLPLKGKRILAVTLATALLPFLETPWVQPSFNHSKIQFFQPLQEGELPNITKPFMAMEHIPIMSGGKSDNGNGLTDPTRSKNMLVHPNASVLALGVLLCELHHCTPVELMQKDPTAVRNVNSDFYTCLEILKNLEVDAGGDYYLATKACLCGEYYPTGEQADFESATVQRLFYQNVVKRLEAEMFKSWGLRLADLDPLDPRENEACWGLEGRKVIREHISKTEQSSGPSRGRAGTSPSALDNPSQGYPLPNSNVVLQMPTRLSRGYQSRQPSAEPSQSSLHFFDASHQSVSGQDAALSENWMENLVGSIYNFVDPFESIGTGPRPFEPVRIAILDSGFNPENPLLSVDGQQIDPRIKDARSFVNQTEEHNIHDQIGHGTHALGLLLNVATSSEIYVAKIANRETLGNGSYDDIAKAINHAVNVWKVDIISMSFGIRENSEPMKTAIKDALHHQTLMFAAASNDGANLGRAFPAKYPNVFCIHSTDGHGNPSAFNPTADERDVNFSLLGEHVVSHWPFGTNGRNEHVNAMSGTSVATPIAAGLAASVLSFVRQQEQNLPVGSELLGGWLKDYHSMDEVLKSMVKRRRGAGYDYITPHTLFDTGASREHVYNKIKDIKRQMYT